MAATQWMLYGAYGVTGRLILEEALQRGHRPVLAGRDPVRLGALAEATGLTARVLRLDRPEPLAAALAEVGLVLNTAGPIAETAPALIEACLATGTRYGDIGGEFHHIRALAARDAQARRAGIAILSGAGFGVTYGEALALHALAQVPDAVSLRLSIAAENAQTSPAARRSVIAVLARGGYDLKGGQFRPQPLAHQRWAIRRGTDDLCFAAAPLGELAALQRSTALAQVVTGRPMQPGAARLLRGLSPILRLALSVPALRAAAGRSRKQSPPQAAPAAETLRSRLWAEVGDAGGRCHLFELETGEGYRASARAAIANVEALLATPDLQGAWTPAAAFGTGILDGIPETIIRRVAEGHVHVQTCEDG